MPDVSVIIPTTRPDTLRAALASVEAQTRRPREVIVLEDERAEGPAVLRNRGAQRARGRFLAFLDDDDAWEPAFLERVVVPGGCVLAYAALPHLPSRHPLDGSPTVPSAAVVVADAFRAAGGFRSWPLGEDYDLFLRLARLGPFRRIEERLVRYARQARGPDHELRLRMCTAAILEDFAATWPKEFGARGRRSLAREYGLLAKALARRPRLDAAARRVQREAAAKAWRLRRRWRHAWPWLRSFLQTPGDESIATVSGPGEAP